MAKKIESGTATYKIELDNLEKIIDKIKDLTKLDKSVVLKINGKELLIYSLVGKGVNIHSFKSHLLKVKDYFNGNVTYKNNTSVDDFLIYKIVDAKKFVTSMTVFIKYMRNQGILEPLDFSLTYQDDYNVEKLLIKNKKSKEETPGERPDANQNIDVEQIEQVMDTELANFSFSLTKEDFNYIKSKTVIEKENDILYLNITDGQLSIGENRWDHNICEIESDEDNTISFPKRYFKCINFDKETEMKIFVTDTHLLILGEDTNLLISVELTI